MALALAAALSFLSGFFLTAVALPRGHKSVSLWLIKLSLAAGFGLGISSYAFFVARMVNRVHLLAIDIVVLIGLLVLYVLVRLGSRSANAADRLITDFSIPRWLEFVLPGSLVVAIVAALYGAVLRMFAHPHGEGWDAFAIWNLHARFLYLGGSHWRDGFNALIPWSHPDYPLLLPATIARFWSYLGHNNQKVPQIVGIGFAFSTVMLSVSSLAQLRGRNAAMLSGLALLGTPFFIEQGTAQYADVPLSFFILASIVLLHLGSGDQKNASLMRGPWLLAGVAAGFAAWAKNEGLLFLASLFLAHIWLFFQRRTSENAPRGVIDRRQDFLLSFVIGTIPLLAVILWFKHTLATAGDLFSSPAVMFQKLATPSRYGAILRWYGKEFLRFGEWWPLPQTVLLVIFYFLVRKKGTAYDAFLRSSRATLILTFAGYFIIYLITPRDLYWHLRFSLNRLFLQLWPATLFLFFLSVGRQSLPPSQNEPEIP